jgi:hypothetical protein
MITSEIFVGRLIEVSIVSPLNEQEVDLFVENHLANLRKVAGQAIVVTDVRRAWVMQQEIIERLIGLMSRANPLLVRSACLTSPSAILTLQIERAFEEAGHDHRRAFREVGDLLSWLEGVASVEELARLRAFVDGR